MNDCKPDVCLAFSSARPETGTEPRLISAALIVGLMFLVSLTACQSPTGRQHSTPVDGNANPNPRFSDASADVGINLAGATYAVTTADYDADGWPDLAISRHASVILFRNSEGVFVEQSSAATFKPEDTHGLGWLDLDHDGRLDLLVSVGANRGFGQGNNQGYRNLGDGRFELLPDLPEVIRDPSGRGRCVCRVDVNGDQLEDLLFMNAPQADRPNRVAVAQPDGSFKDALPKAGVTSIEAECVRTVRLTPGAAPLLLAYGGGRDSGHVFRLKGDGEIDDITAELGLPTHLRTNYNIATGDVDNDGDLDLYFVRGHEVPPQISIGPDYLGFRLIAAKRGEMPRFRFRCPGSFEADLLVGFNAKSSMLHFGQQRTHPRQMPMQVSSTDPLFDGEPEISPDDDLGIFMWRVDEDVYEVLVVGDGAQVRGVSGLLRSDGPFEVLTTPPQAEPRQQPRPNRLFIYDNGRFSDGTDHAGVGDTSSGRDAAFFDADNDGDLDLFITNGGLAFANHGDVLLLNRGDGTFFDATAEAGVTGPLWGRGCTVTVIDVNQDGRQDLFVTNGDGPPHGNNGRYTLWRNESETHNNWAEIRIEASNAGMLGVQVLVLDGDRQLLLTRSSTNGRFSTSDAPFHIGLGSAQKVTVEVYWPSGHSETVEIDSGSRISITETASF